MTDKLYVYIGMSIQAGVTAVLLFTGWIPVTGEQQAAACAFFGLIAYIAVLCAADESKQSRLEKLVEAEKKVAELREDIQ